MTVPTPTPWRATLPQAVRDELAAFDAQVETLHRAREVYLQGVVAALGAPRGAQIRLDDGVAAQVVADAPAALPEGDA